MLSLTPHLFNDKAVCHHPFFVIVPCCDLVGPFILHRHTLKQIHFAWPSSYRQGKDAVMNATFHDHIIASSESVYTTTAQRVAGSTGFMHVEVTNGGFE
jgi:hypothetical protein